MEQKDYLLREIEKIGVLLKALVAKLFGKESDLSIPGINRFEEVGNDLLEFAAFDMTSFLQMEHHEAIEYLKGFKGFNAGNIEHLSIILESLGADASPDRRASLLEKALLTLDYGIALDKTFIFEREHRRARLLQQVKG
jgi:hypothetical protein